MPVLTFARGPRARLLILLLFLTILPLLWFGDSLSEHVVGLILAGLGVTILWFGLIPALRVGVLLKRGVQMQGTVVGAEQQKGQGVNDIPYTTHHPIVQFTTADGRTVEFTSGGGAAP